MKILRATPALQAELKRLRRPGRTVGFVPTMGALHDGHAELIRRARATCDTVVVSIFVNPLQFGPQEDLAKYPRDLAADARVCRRAGADIIFAPEPEAFLKMKSLVRVPAPPIKKYLCGPFRPGHFDGVTTIVAHFFRIVRPDLAFFGLKDYQQYRVIEEMTRLEFGGAPRIVPVPTVRERGGLAMSSRNRYLSPRRRKAAVRFYRVLSAARTRIRAGAGAGKGAAAAGKNRVTASEIRSFLRTELAKDGLFRVQYAEVGDARSLRPLTGRLDPRRKGGIILAAAVFLDGTRLIDNVLV
jgi:pantoate--beta-alanine ligase